jgi:sirohydrochlorin cobaltochelatase
MILLIGHGSRDPEGVAGFLAFAAAVRTAAPGLCIQDAFLEFGGGEVPTIARGVALCAAAGARRILAVPALLLDAGHRRRDVPAALRVAHDPFPHLDMRLAPALGAVPGVLDAVESRLADAPWGGEPGAAVILVAAGSSSPEGNGDFYRLARLLWERRPGGLVEPAFISVTEPGVPAAIERCVRLGAERVIVVPFFISPGRLPGRVPVQVERTRSRFPGLEIVVTPTLAPHPGLVMSVIDRIAELAAECDGAQEPRGLAWRDVPAGPHNVHQHYHDHAHSREGDHRHQDDDDVAALMELAR